MRAACHFCQKNPARTSHNQQPICEACLEKFLATDNQPGLEDLNHADDDRAAMGAAANERILFCAERRSELAQHDDFFALVAPTYLQIVSAYKAAAGVR